MVKYKITLGRAEITKVYPDRETDKFVVTNNAYKTLSEARLLHEDN
jgi:hypothetical protein